MNDNHAQNPAEAGSNARTAVDLATRFATPDARKYGPVPIWWWSGATLTRERLRWQMEQLLSQGIAQAVILNLAPTGPLYGALADDPPFMSEKWWEIFLGACADAAELGFAMWPYDQIGFSGANLQGRLITDHPEWAGQAIGRLQLDLGTAAGAGTLAVPRGAVALTAYVVSPDGLSAQNVLVTSEGARATAVEGTLTLVYAQTRGFDYYSLAATSALIDTVHGEFARRAEKWFGTVIAGFFQDELPSMPTWSANFSETFAQRYGFSLESHLGALWDDALPGSATGPAAAEVRRMFHEHRATLAHRAFFGPLQDWFDGHGLICGFDQQSPAREGDPVGATSLYGNYLELHGSYGAPGSDHWGDSKVHSSLAHAGDKPRTWLESFHSSGWGGTLEETYDWLAPFMRRGATLYNPHAVYYSTVGGWWEWAPPSTCWRQPYWGQYHVLAESVARLSELFTTGVHVADTVLVFPTSTVQSSITLDGSLPAAAEAGKLYHALNGTPAWYAERPGILDRSGHDYDIFDETVLAAATVEGAVLRVGHETYRNVVLPGTTILRADVAAVLLQFAEAGGNVIVVGAAPVSLVGRAVAAGESVVLSRWAELAASGTIVAVANPELVPAKLASNPVWVEADVPHLLRRVGDTWVIALFAHDSISGTDQPIIRGGGSGIEWIETTWDAYWDEITRNGYSFRPVTGRQASVTVHGIDGLGAQVWDPRTGTRRHLTDRVGSAPVTVGFDSGTVTLIVLGSDLPEADDAALGPIVGSELLDAWVLDANSLLDNSRGDFAAASRSGILPIEVWEFDHIETSGGVDTARGRVTATFGPFADVLEPARFDTATPWAASVDSALWQPASWSLSRGIEQDSVHGDSLGPKGYVPEEFLSWTDVTAGDWVAVKTTITVPSSDGALLFTVGANAGKVVLIDGSPVSTSGDGYLAATPIASGLHRIEIWLEAEGDENIRAAFAVVRGLDGFHRPEWLVPVSASVEPTVWEAVYDFEVGALETGAQAPDTRIQVGSECPCTVYINGVEIGRQSDFDPYAERRFGRLHPYDLRTHLVAGVNQLRLASLEGGRSPAVLVDSRPLKHGGLGITSGAGTWGSFRNGEPTALRQRSQQWQDPRFVSIDAKPHPLPRADWLETPEYGADTVIDIVPDRDMLNHPVQALEFLVPIGAVGVTVPTELAFFGVVDGRRYEPAEGKISLDTPASPGTTMRLVFEASAGRRAGAVLDAAVQVETTAVVADLLDWSELGLAALAGEVVYRTTIGVPKIGAGEALVLDLGEVRGSASVELNGRPVGHLAWSPYRIDLTETLREIAVAPSFERVEIQVRVHNTLAGYLNHASPTPAVFAGQTRAGMFGPVTLIRHESIG